MDHQLPSDLLQFVLLQHKYVEASTVFFLLLNHSIGLADNVNDPCHTSPSNQTMHKICIHKLFNGGYLGFQGASDFIYISIDSPGTIIIRSGNSRKITPIYRAGVLHVESFQDAHIFA